jgi:hypothetical protein
MPSYQVIRVSGVTDAISAASAADALSTAKASLRSTADLVKAPAVAEHLVVLADSDWAAATKDSLL